VSRSRLIERMTPLVQRVSATRGFAKVAPRVVPVMDKVVHRLSGGRVLLSSQMLPGVVLTAVGAKSGLPRRTPLACMPEEGGAFVLVGSNFGRPEHPAWTANLLRNPEAEVMGGAAAVLAAVRGVCGAGGAGDPALPADAALAARAGGLGVPHLAPSRNQGATPLDPRVALSGAGGWVGTTWRRPAPSAARAASKISTRAPSVGDLPRGPVNRRPRHRRH
jgi:deazaflavin-dependent oxidoreductase (nitroreductase family)